MKYIFDIHYSVHTIQQFFTISSWSLKFLYVLIKKDVKDYQKEFRWFKEISQQSSNNFNLERFLEKFIIQSSTVQRYYLQRLAEIDPEIDYNINPKDISNQDFTGLKSRQFNLPNQLGQLGGINDQNRKTQIEARCKYFMEFEIKDDESKEDNEDDSTEFDDDEQFDQQLKSESAEDYSKCRKLFTQLVNDVDVVQVNDVWVYEPDFKFGSKKKYNPVRATVLSRPYTKDGLLVRFDKIDFIVKNLENICELLKSPGKAGKPRLRRITTQSVRFPPSFSSARSASEPRTQI